LLQVKIKLLPFFLILLSLEYRVGGKVTTLMNCVCRVLFPFPPEKEACIRWYEAECLRTRELVPYVGSTWYRAIHHTNRDAKRRGELLRSTLLSGGSIYGALSTFNDLRKMKSSDLERGVISTDVEWAHNCEGVRVFFELDYRSPENFPSTTDVMLHLSHIQQVVQEAYPTLLPEQYEMHIATCAPIVVEVRGISLCKWGIHIVFPHIVTTTQQLRVLAGAVDTRITRDSVQWKDIVDAASYKEANATLRPPFSYKAEKCVLCNAKGGKKRARAQDTTIEDLLAADCDCWHGYRVQPSVYLYCASITSKTTAMEEEECVCMRGIQARCALSTVDAILQGMSIQPSNGGLFTTEFKPCADMYELAPIVHQRGPSKENKIRGVNKRRKELPIPAGYEKSCHAILQGAINRTHVWYRATVIESVRYYPCKKYGEFFVSVKGPGMRSCLHSNKIHRSNRIYFILRVFAWTLSIGCFDTECAQKTMTFVLQPHEITALAAIPLQGIPSFSSRPKMEKVVNVFQMSAMDRYNECQKRIKHMSF
jgi:hypothetical protein